MHARPSLIISAAVNLVLLNALPKNNVLRSISTTSNIL